MPFEEQNLSMETVPGTRIGSAMGFEQLADAPNVGLQAASISTVSYQIKQ